MTDAPAASPVSLSREGRVGLLRFDRGDGVNALDSALIEALTDTLHALYRDDELSVLVISGGPRVFSAGYDLKEVRARLAARADLTARRRAARLGRDLSRALTALEPLTIAAVEGWCIGGGVVIAAGCDLRVASREARFFLPEVERGMNMSWASVPRLTALIGPARAKRFVALAERLDAPTAETWGLVDRLVDPAQAEAAALAWAAEAAALPPIALRMCKMQVDAAAHGFDAALSAFDRDQFVLASLSDDHEEAVTAFLDRRRPEFHGR